MAEDNSPASRDAIRKWMSGIRRTHDIKQEVLGDKLGVSRSTIANWESGVRTVPLSVVDKLIALFPGVKAPVETQNVPTVPDILGKPLFPVGFAPVPMRYAGIVPASTEWGDPLASEELIEVDGKYVNA